MLEIGKDIKKYFGDVKHVVCLCHNLHLLAEEIRKKNDIINTFIAKLKHVLIKNKTNLKLYKISTDLAPIKFPILTRWGTFLICADFIFQNLDSIKQFISCLDEDSKKLFEELMNKEDFLYQLEHVSNYIFIAKAITKLESLNLTLAEQFDIVKGVKINLKSDYLKTRLEEILSKNPDLCYLESVKDNENNLFMNMNLINAAVERSFSFLRNLLSERRQSIKSQNIFSYISVNNTVFNEK